LRVARREYLESRISGQYEGATGDGEESRQLELPAVFCCCGDDPAVSADGPPVPTSELRIWLADDAAEYRFRLYSSASQLLIQPVDGRVIGLDVEQLPLLLPMEIL